MTRVLLAMSDTGGGHRAISNALAQSMRRLYGDNVEISIDDVFALGRSSIFDASTRLYNPLLRHAPWLYGWVFHLFDRPRLYSTIAKQVEMMDAPKVKRLLEARRPDIIVSVHSLANRPLIRARSSLGWDIPIVAQVTELVTVHNSWVDPRIDRFMTATSEASDAVIALGADSTKVFLTGLPVDERFGKVNKPQSELRRTLGLDRDCYTALLMGGGEGAGGIGKIAQAADRADLNVQLIIVCGKNRALKRRLDSHPLRLPSHVLGFVDNIPELMHTSDVIVTKGGPGSIAESLAAKRPVILTAITPGQEEGNDAWIERHGVGLAPKSRAGVIEGLRVLSSNSAMRSRFARNTERWGRPDSAAVASECALSILGVAPFTLLPVGDQNKPGSR